MQADPAVSSPSRRFLGYVLMTTGGLLALLSGACTLAWLGLFGLSVARSATPAAGIIPAILVALPVGGLPIAIGVAMIVGGRSMLKTPRRPPDSVFE